MYLLNKLNDVGLKYEIHTKEYHWHYFGEESPKATGEFYGECLGIRIIVNLNDRYKVSIIQAFNEATGKFYGDDTWDMAFVDTDLGWHLLKEFEICDGYFSSNDICDGEECIKHIERFIKEKGLET